MNTPRTILLGCLCACVFLASGFGAQARRAPGWANNPAARGATIDPSVAAEVARAQAQAALAARPGAAALLHFQP